MNGVLETTFCSQVTFGQARTGKSGQNWPSFTRGDSVGNKMKAKFMTQIDVD